MLKIPRLTRSIFLDQFIYMQAVGVFIGLAFPHFLVWYGFAAEQVLNWHFYIVTQIAGQTVGLISFLLISMVIRPHLKLLSHKMQDIAEGLHNKNLIDYSAKCNEELCHIDVHSDDEIGVSAHAYNQLLTALIDSHEIERVYSRFSKSMSENLEVSALADEAISLLIEATHIEAGAVLIMQNAQIEVVASKGILSADSLADHDAIIRSINKGESTRILMPKNLQLDGVLTHFNPSEVFIEPIEFKGAHLGALVAATGAKMADNRTELVLQLFSRSIGLALNNALIHSKFQKLAAIDGLTNVYNRRFGMGRLKEDFSRILREPSPLSVAMIDIDHFKNVNDTYGHLVGDKAIVMIAQILKDVLREGDIVVRYGGEEFLMILYGASAASAMPICERIRHQIKDTVLMDGSQRINLSVSIGVCSYPEVAVSDEMALIDKADQALYHAKQTGRDRVVEFGKMNA
jgi:diguanylate cyclase (GGDEF)-like protein